MKKAVSLIDSALTEGRIESALATLKRECTVAELDDVLKALLWCWDSAPNMAGDFHQSSSDACPMECSESEDYETRFKEWAMERMKHPEL